MNVKKMDDAIFLKFIYRSLDKYFASGILRRKIRFQKCNHFRKLFKKIDGKKWAKEGK